MNVDIFTILYFAIGIFSLILGGIAGAVISQLMGIRIQRPHLVVKEKSDLPEYLNDVFARGIKLLDSLGFEYHHCQYTLDIVCHQRDDKWSLVFFNKETNVYAEISPASSFLDLPGYEIDFWSISSDGTALITMNGRGHTILCGITNAEIHDPMAITLAEVYQSHLDERGDVFGKKPLVALTSENYTKVQQKLFDGYFLNLMNERAVVSTGSNEFRLTFAKSRRLLPQVLRGQKRLRKLLHDKLVSQDKQNDKLGLDEQTITTGDHFSVEAEVQSYLRMRSVQERTPGGITARLVFLFLVLSLTYFAFDLTFTVYSIVILICVFGLHECGHIVSMALFGYRNYQILFLPIFVDTTRREKQSPAIWKQVVVYLMGPIPGIVIGILLLGLSQEYEIGWFYEAAILLLVVNYLNLLPVPPLDGGHLIRFTVMERFPSGKLILVGMGGLAFAAGGWYLAEPVFWVIAIILFGSLPWSALEAGVLSELFQPTSEFENLDRKQRLACLFETFRQPKFAKLQYLQKFNLIKGLSDTLLLPDQLGRLGALGLNAIYLGALLLTPPLAIVTIIGMDDTVDMVAEIQGSTPEKNWDTLIDNMDKPEEKYKTTLEAARFYTSTNNFIKAQSYLEQAEKFLAQIYSESTLADLYNTYAFYYLNKQELDTAEEYQVKVIKLLDQSPKENAFELTISYQNLAAIHEHQTPSKSLLDLKTALSYSLNIQSPEERYVINSVINQLLNKYYTDNDHTGAKSILLDSLSVISRYQDTPSKYVSGFIYQELGWMNLMAGNLNESIKQFENAMALSSDSNIKIVDVSDYGYDPFTKVNILLAMAVVQNKAENVNSAKAYIQQAESLLNTNYNESLSTYISINLPDGKNSETSTENTTPTAVSSESPQKNQRWEMISQLLSLKANEQMTPLELPKPVADSTLPPKTEASTPESSTEVSPDAKTSLSLPENKKEQSSLPAQDNSEQLGNLKTESQ